MYPVDCGLIGPHRIRLQTSFQIHIPIYQLRDCDLTGRIVNPIAQIVPDYLFLLPQLFQRFCVDILPFFVNVSVTIHIGAVFPLAFTIF